MEKTDILSRVQEIFQDVLDDDTIELTNETTSDDVDDWDSLTHIQIVVAIQKEFGIKFTASEIQSWPSIGALVDCIAAKL